MAIPSIDNFVFGETLASADLNAMLTDSGALADGTGIEDDAITPAKLALVNYQTDNSDSIASVTNGNVKLQMGWGQQVGGGASTLGQAVTFPVAYTTVLGVSVSFLSAKSAPTAATIGALDTSVATTNGFNIGAEDVTTTGFSVNMGRATGTFSNVTYYGYSWIAWGL